MSYIYPRNAGDALIRAAYDKDAKVHLHIDEVIEEMSALKMMSKAETFEEAAERIKKESQSTTCTTYEWLLKKAKHYREQEAIFRSKMREDYFAS